MIETFLRPNDSQERALGMRAPNNDVKTINDVIINNPKLIRADECRIGGIYKLYEGEILGLPLNYFDNKELVFIGKNNRTHKRNWTFIEKGSLQDHFAGAGVIFQVISEPN